MGNWSSSAKIDAFVSGNLIEDTIVWVQDEEENAHDTENMFRTVSKISKSNEVRTDDVERYRNALEDAIIARGRAENAFSFAKSVTRRLKEKFGLVEPTELDLERQFVDGTAKYQNELKHAAWRASEEWRANPSQTPAGVRRLFEGNEIRRANVEKWLMNARRLREKCIEIGGDGGWAKETPAA